MSSARCCCEPGTYTQVTRCSCTPGSTDPTFIENYDPDLGCVYLKDGSNVCWYAGPESPSKDTLDAGDVTLGSPTLVPVESADLACCLCCECGGENATPLGCFDTPVGGCQCCPEDGDGTEWIWTWQSSWQKFEGARLNQQLNTGGTMHWKDAGSSNCARVLAIDASNDYWSYSPFTGALICERHETVVDCSELLANFWQDTNWGTAPCGDRIIPDQWRLPRKTWGGSSSCDILKVIETVALDPFNVNHWTGTSGCTWLGTTYETGPEGLRFTTVGAVLFSGDCHHSRIEWSFTVSEYNLPDETFVRKLVASGFLDLQVVSPACPGGCGHLARYFGLNDIPSGGGVSPLVPRSLEGLLR